ncbi:methyltransferase [Brachybacterium sp. ACRRE]|uniref:RraA family protein n=1 Tax=Brachybacterium sp. ACRRE TaxID=2918184 RepID=UPI001EF20BFA|nr:methyltransferase [Brachybacterium sp. ACRRE]MCG7310342.1 methyltransferase [Brachybacterium sp. ACRRE]
MSQPGFVIHEDPVRPDPSILERFRGLPAAAVGDASHRTAALPSRIAPMNDAPILGVAYTVDVQPGDNLLLYYAIDNAQPGDVLVVAGKAHSERALCGEIMAELAQARGLGGLVIDGAIRDREELAVLDIPVRAAACTPNGPFKHGPGTVNAPVAIGDRVVHPGDIVLGDATGIVTVPAESAEEVAAAAAAIVTKEEGMLAGIREQGNLDLAWMYAALEQSDCEIRRSS